MPAKETMARVRENRLQPKRPRTVDSPWCQDDVIGRGGGIRNRMLCEDIHPSRARAKVRRGPRPLSGAVPARGKTQRVVISVSLLRRQDA